MSGGYEFGKQWGKQGNRGGFNPATQPLVSAPQQGNVNYDEWSDVVKTPLKGLGWLLDSGSKYVGRPAVGALARGVANQGPLGKALGVNLANAPFVHQRYRDPEMIKRLNEGSFTDAFNAAMEGRSTGQRLLIEAGSDPYNVIGVGAPVLKGLGAGANVVRNVQRGEDLANAAMAAPLIVPLKGIRAGARKVIPGLAEKSSKNVYRTRDMDFQNMIDTLRDLNLPLDVITESGGDLSRMPVDIFDSALRQADDTQAMTLIRGTDDTMLGRTFDRFSNLTPETPEARNIDLIFDELNARGLMKRTPQGEVIKSGRLRAYMQADEVSDALQHGADERQTYKDAIDMGAYVLRKENPKKFKTIDEAYDFMNIRSDFNQAPRSADELYQTWNDLVGNDLESGRIVNLYDESGEMIPEMREAAIQFWNADVPELIRRGAEIQEIMGDARAAEWYQNVGKAAVMMGFRDDVPAFSEDVIHRMLTQTDPNYSARVRAPKYDKKTGDIASLGPAPATAEEAMPGEVFKGSTVLPDTNPLLDSANRMGETLINRLDRRVAQAAGIDLGKYADGTYSGPAPAMTDEAIPFSSAQRLDEADTYKYVAERMRGLSQRRLFATLWGAGGIGLSPQGNTGVVMNWFKQMAVDGVYPSGFAAYPESYQLGRRAAGNLGEMTDLNQDALDALWLNPDFRYPGRGPKTGVTESQNYWTQAVADEGFSGTTAVDNMGKKRKRPSESSATEIMEREFPTDQRVQVHGLADKIHSYADAVYEYANMWEAYDFIRRTDPEAAAEFLSTGVRNIPGVVLDRHMWRLFGENKASNIGKKATGKAVKAGQPENTVSANTLKGMADLPGDSPEEWAAGKALSEILYQETRNHPVLKGAWRNANEVQAALWYVSFLNQNKSGTGFGFAKAMLDVFNGRQVGSVITKADIDEVYRLTGDAWNDPARLREAVEATQKPHGNSIIDFLSDKSPKQAYEEILKSGYVKPSGAHIDEVAEWFKTTPGALQELMQAAPELNQVIDDAVRGSFQMSNDTGRATVSFRPGAGASTAIHEIMGHGVRHGVGGEAQANIRRGVGEPVYRERVQYDPDDPRGFRGGGLDDAANQATMSRGAEERFAEGVEGTVRGAVPNNPADAERWGRAKKLMDLEYLREQGRNVPDDDILNLLSDPISNRTNVPMMVMARAKAGRASADDIRQLVTSGEYATISPRTTEELGDPNLTKKMDQMQRDLENMGYSPIRAEGVYGGAQEPSFFVPGMGRDDAMKLGQRYDQESVLMGREGLVYTDGTGKVDPNMPSLPTWNESDNFTRILAPDGEEIRFSQDIDWDKGNLTRIRDESAQATRYSDPYADASVRDVLDQIAMEAGKTTDEAIQVSDELTKVIQPIFDKNPQAAAVNMWYHPNVKQHLTDAMNATDPAQRRAALDRAANEIDGLWGSFGMNHPVLSKFVNTLLPPDLRKSVMVQTRGGRNRSGSRLTERQRGVLDNAKSMEEINKVQKNYNDNVNVVREIVDDINTKHPISAPFGDTTTYRDLKRVYEYADESQRKVLDGFFKTFDIPEISAEEAVNLTVRQAQERNLIIAHQKGLAKQLGIDYNKTPSGLKALANKATATWREQALLSVRYHMANGMDMMVKSAIFGINPLVPPGSAQGFVAKLGRSMPRGVRVEAHSPRNLAGLPAEFADVADASNLPGPLGTVSKGSRKLARGMENVVREAAFRQGAVDNLQRNMPGFEAMVRRELGDEAAEVVLKDMRSSMHGVSFSSQQLSETIVLNGGDSRAASRLAQQWDRHIDDAFAEGASLSNLVHFDFGDERKIEESLKLRQWAPFHFWATRNVPFYLDTLASHPGIMRRWQDYMQESERVEEEEGLPRRLKGMVPLPGPADKFLDTIFGPGRSFFNPMVILSIADQAKPRFQDEDQPMIGQLLDKAAYVGLAPAPWFSYPLSIAGAFGPDDEQMPVLRHSSIVRDATGLATGTGGLDVEQPLRAVTNRARELVTGKKVQTISGSAYKDYQISKRIAEMSIEQTGYANHPEFTAAMRNPDHPLYQKAARDVQKENLATGIQHFVTPLPHKRLPETEELIRDRQGVMPEGAMADRDFRDTLVNRGDPAGAYLRTPKPKVLEPVLQDQYGNVQKAGAGAPTTDATRWGGSIWGPDSPPPFNNRQVFDAYLSRVNRTGYISPYQFVSSVMPNNR